MCGINGIYSKKVIKKIDLRIAQMNKSIEHRGPNGDGVKVMDSTIGLGHRRLSIIDLNERSNQPMESVTQKGIIVFNGEIFNFKDIRDILSSEYLFHTESDTEVILAAMELKGVDWFLSKANGMFAFGYYNQQDKTLTLARDRFGIKPLFYHYDGEVLVFSSEIKGILNSGLVEAKFNDAAIDDYLGHRYVREPFTFFKDILQVKSSTYIVFSLNDRPVETTYWQLPRLNFQSKYDENYIIREAKERVKEAVNRWLMADVKVGAYLSGGVDSSLTTAILSETVKTELDTYTIGFEENNYNEFEYARMVAKRYHTNHREFLLSKSNYFDEWQRLIGFKDAPLAVPNEIPLAIMTTNLSKDITVVISGEGADELFGGYGKIFRFAFDFKNHEDPSADFYQGFIDEYEYVPRKVRDKYLKSEENYRSHFDCIIKSDFLNKPNEECIFRFFHNYHIKGLLNRVDMTTMQASIEARPPFLDHELIEYVYNSIPYELKLKWKSDRTKTEAKNSTAKIYSEILDTPKYILKKVAEDYLPNEVIYRKKMGFPVPLTEWFPEIVETAKDILADADWLNSAAADELIEDIKSSGNGRSGQLLWMFLNIEFFKRNYFTKNWQW